MSQAGYTPIQLYYSTTAAAVPVNTNLADGELAININDGKLYYKDNGGTVRLLASNATSAPVLSFSAGTTGFTPSTATTGAVTLAGTLATTNGGTGLTSFTSGGVVYASSSSALVTGSDLVFSSGNLGVGGTPVSYKLEVFGSTSGRSAILSSNSNSAGSSGFHLGTDIGANVGNVLAFGSTHPTRANQMWVGTEQTYPLVFQIAGAEASRLDIYGNLGLGTATLYPSAPHVYAPQIRVGLTGNYFSQSNVGLGITGTSFIDNAYIKSSIGDFAYITSAKASRINARAGEILFQRSTGTDTSDAAVNFVTSAVIDSSGNVGIGISPPTVKLDVNGEINLADNQALRSAGQLLIRRNATTNELRIGSGSITDYLAFYAGATEYFRIATTGAFGLTGANYGTSGQVLTSGGSGAAPTWTTVGGGGGSAATPTALGTVYGKTVTTGGSNTLLGYQAGLSDTAGGENVAVGYQALYTPTGSYDNTAIGYQALYADTTGGTNSALGYRALYNNTTGNENVALSAYALLTNSTGSYNTAVGNTALRQNQTGNYNSAFGNGALYANTTASNNVAFGASALTTNTTGSNNVAVGSSALTSNTTGIENTAVGKEAMVYNTTGEGNTASGYKSLNSNTTGVVNTATGYFSLYSNTTGSYNTASGFYALQQNTTALNNSAFGNQALRYNTTGTYNVAVGSFALQSNTTANGNTAVGYDALNVVTTAGSNVSIGKGSGGAVTTGGENVFIGFESATYITNLTTGSNNTLIGFRTRTNAVTDNECIVIGSSITGKGGSTGFINPNGGGIYQGNNTTTWTTTSDQRLKKNIVDNNIGLEKLTQIQVRNFEYRLPDEVDAELKPTDAIEKTGVQLGVIAQELQAVLPECVKQESTGVMSVDSDNLIWYAINAIKELKAEVDSLKSQLNQGA